MRTTFRTACGAIILAFAAEFARTGPVLADTYALDKETTEVRFSWNHLGLSRQSGRFNDVTGTVTFDPAAPETTTADIKIKITSLSTGVAELDRALTRTKDYFDTDTYPEAAFRSTGVRYSGGKTATMTGDLTMNGVTHPVTLDVTWNFTGEHPMATINPVYKGVYVSGFSATTQIRRSDWGITRTVPYVSDEIRISIETEMERTGISAPEAHAADSPGRPPPDDQPLSVEREDLPPALPWQQGTRGGDLTPLP